MTRPSATNKSPFSRPSSVTAKGSRSLYQQILRTRVSHMPILFALLRAFSPKRLLPARADPKNYQGSGWCVCGNGKTYAETSKDISTTNEAGSKTVLINVCPYTAPPASEFKPTPISTAAPAVGRCSDPADKRNEECSRKCAPRPGVCYNLLKGEV